MRKLPDLPSGVYRHYHLSVFRFTYLGPTWEGIR